MIIKIGYIGEEKNAITKTPQWNFTLNNCTLRQECSITDPVILMEVSGTTTGDYEDNVEMLTHCNYMWVEAFDRNYFINDIVFVRSEGLKGIYQINGHCDVLSSFFDDNDLNEIYNQTALIVAQQNVSNPYYNNGLIKTDVTKTYETTEFTNGFLDGSNGLYVLITTGKH